MHMFEFFYGVMLHYEWKCYAFEDAMITICKMQNELRLGSRTDQILQLCGETLLEEICLRKTLQGEHRLLTHAGEQNIQDQPDLW